jgi:hypothetical protein
MLTEEMLPKCQQNIGCNEIFIFYFHTWVALLKNLGAGSEE